MSMVIHYSKQNNNRDLDGRDLTYSRINLFRPESSTQLLIILK